MTAHPGPRPPEFDFPFVEAVAVLGAIDDALGALADVIGAHEWAAADVRVNFAGQTRDGFDQGFAQLMDRARAAATALAVQRDQVEADIAVARRRRDQQLDAIADWGRALQRFTLQEPP
jgi:hypothetical protein